VVATVATFAAKNLLRHAIRRGIPSSLVSGWLGASPAELERPGRLSAVAHMSAWERLRDELDDNAVGARVGQEYLLSDWGLVGFAIGAAPTVDAAVTTAARYVGLVTSAGSWSFRNEGALVAAVWSRPGAPSAGLRISDDVTVASFVRHFTDLANERPRHVELVHRPGRAARDLAVLFGCDVRCGADRNAVVFDRELCAVRPPKGSPELFAYLCRLADAEVSCVRPGPLLDRAAGVIAEHLAREGCRPHLSQVARYLGVSERTLRRRLAASGVSFRALATRACLDHAAHLVVESGASCTEAALAVGYSDASAFSRAWKKQRGERPSRAMGLYRR
jgi:AraC-like DNA-binding protein